MKRILFILFLICPIISFGQTEKIEIFNKNLDSILSYDSWSIANFSKLYDADHNLSPVYYKIDEISDSISLVKIIKRYQEKEIITETSLLINTSSNKIAMLSISMIGGDGSKSNSPMQDPLKDQYWTSPLPDSPGIDYLKLIVKK